MPYIRMKRIFLRGLLWLYLLIEFGFMAMSLEPGFLDFDNLPDTNFSCVGKVIGGYYADLETNCQMFHVCTIGQLDEPMDIRFLCLNGTVFDQETRVCERIDEVDCSKSEKFYSLNLELYGNTQSAILEDSPETEQPLIIKPTTITTTTTRKPTRVSNAPYYPSPKPPLITTTQGGGGGSSSAPSRPFTLGTSTDIRFNPEEINISLHPDAPPDIRTKPYQQQTFSDNTKNVLVAALSDNSNSDKISVTTTRSQPFDVIGKVSGDDGSVERPQVQGPSTQKTAHHQGYKAFHHPTPSDINYEFTPNHQDYHTELPQNFFHSDFHNDQDYAGHHHSPLSQQFKSSTFRNDFTSTTKGGNNPYQQKIHTTIRNFFSPSLKPPAANQQHHYTQQHQTEKSHRVQLPLPLLPTLPSLSFSSPAPFSLQHHIESKRYTKDHPSPPRIVISASASVSDNSGRRLNYSLGTIGAAEFLEPPPHSYDEYKDDDDISLDPFYHDVPKLEKSRTKRQTGQLKHSDIIRSEQEAVGVLRFLFDWYKNNEKTAVQSTTLPTVVSTEAVSTMETVEDKIEQSESNESQETAFTNSALFDRNSKFSIIGNDTVAENAETISLTAEKTTTTESSKDFVDEVFGHEDEYVNDNYEPIAYKEKYNKETGVTKSPRKVENQSLPKDYVDDNIEPIYFRDRDPILKSSDKETLKENSKITQNEMKKEVSKSTTTKITNINNEAKKQSKVGDTATNNIKQNTREENKENQYDESTLNNADFTEPKSEILESSTTEKPTTTTHIILKTNRRRGRKRYFTPTEKEKEPENKNVVLEKITEKAHTAKDDFNYLRTLYKVYSTTPTYYVTATKSLEPIATSSTQRIINNNDLDTDVKEASPSDKVLQTSIKEIGNPQEEEEEEPRYLIPTITTEETTTIAENMVSSTASNTGRNLSSTENNTPSATIVVETSVPSSTITPETSTTSTTTLVKSSLPSSTTITETSTTSTTTVVKTSIKSSSTMTEISTPPATTMVETSTPISDTTTTTVSIPPNRESRRRGRNRYHAESTTRSTPRRRSHVRKRPGVTLEDTAIPSVEPEKVLPSIPPHITETGAAGRPQDLLAVEAGSSDSVTNRYVSEVVGTTGKPLDSANNRYGEIVIEENGSNINRNIVLYPGITSEYSATTPNRARFGGSTEPTEFLTQLTLNYKRIFEDVSQTSGPLSQVIDVSSLAVTESYAIPSPSVDVTKREFKLDFDPTLLPSSTAENPTTTVKYFENTTLFNISENFSTSVDLLNSETPILEKTEATTTIGNVTEAQPTNTNTGKYLEFIPTTLTTTEEAVNDKDILNITEEEEITHVTIKVPEKVNDKDTVKITEEQLTHVTKKASENKVLDPTTTQLEVTTEPLLLDETKSIETIPTTFSVSENTPVAVAATEKIDQSLNVTKDLDSNSEATKLDVHQIQSTTPDSLKKDSPVIAKITEIFTLPHSTPKETVFKSDDSIKATDFDQFVPVIPSQEPTESSTESSTIESVTETKIATDIYPNTIYIVRTTPKPEPEKKFTEVETEFPSTVLVIRTTENPKSSQYSEDHLYNLVQLSNENLKKLIEEIEENTKSVVATTVPSTFTEVRATTVPTDTTPDIYQNLKEIIATTERRDDLQDLTSLFQYVTKSEIKTTTVPTIIATPGEPTTTETTIVTSTTELASSTKSSAVAIDPELMSTSQIERLTATEEPFATTASSRRRGNVRRGGGRWNQQQPRARSRVRHRFSTESFTKHPDSKQTVEEEIIDELTKGSRSTTTESYHRRLRIRNRNELEQSTDPPIRKSASPTQPERNRESLPTTPLSKEGAAKRHFIFNCFEKEVNKFYPDPRDCRLFHYCTQGYSKHQLIDMKFVCDLNTYFDDQKLICSKRKPRRCL